ncbi:MAG: sn-glycerol-3-phosphate ABC transporter ATP-binding protein UgpC [Lewinellaceae bacterium]|nr:sn-glycerol-3-phosphate ABC transporter ATP-binding protein UgpC [Lewinellaceae bacterium]
MAGIIFEGVSKSYGKVEVVKGIDFEVKNKEFMVLVGPSGCGKSTLLRMVAGLEEISSGKLYIGNTLVNDIPPKDRDIAIVFQNYALYPHMTAYQNLAFGLKIRRFDKKEIQERVLEAAKILDIEALLDRKPKAMSGGQRQRVAIGRAIVRHPKVFLFDEPLSNLDAKLRGQMRIEIAKLHQKLQTTVVYVTHDQVEAMTLGHRIAVMNKGSIQQLDTPDRLYAHPRTLFVAGFIGTPPMNLIAGRAGEENGSLFFQGDGQTFKAKINSRPELRSYLDKEIVLGIRPEAIHLRKQTDKENYAVLNCKIQFVERLGHESFAFFLLQDKQLVARLKPEEPIRPGEEVDLFFEVDKMHFFDKVTEEVINPAPPPAPAT